MIKEIKHDCVGTCSRSLTIKYDDETNIITDFEIIGGCNGNLKGIKSLIIGMNLKDVYSKLKGIKCGFKNTSCPDQIATAIEPFIN